MPDLNQLAQDYERIVRAISFLERNFQEQPSLEEIAATIHLSPYHFHRLFRRWAGITPKQFLQFLTIDYAKQRLADSASILETSYEAGLSGPGRLHDLFVTFEAMTPGEYKSQGQGLQIEYGFHPTPFGTCLLAMTARGVCSLSFVEDGQQEQVLVRLHRAWPQADFHENVAATGSRVAQVFAPDPATKPVPLLIKGTNFQIKVWEALLRIPTGAVVSYSTVAAAIGQPTAARAVAGAVARNPIGYLIPCHRVIRQAGLVNNYRWGSTRKKAILGWEAAHQSSAN
jgi:AraC family transcriptional regulator of adaptative response/methylated-DNA-[protein]-cysteine methyltransferase